MQCRAGVWHTHRENAKYHWINLPGLPAPLTKPLRLTLSVSLYLFFSQSLSLSTTGTAKHANKYTHHGGSCIIHKINEKVGQQARMMVIPITRGDLI